MRNGPDTDRDVKAWVIPAVLVACTGVSILSTDLHAPSLPHLPRLLDSDAETVQLTMTLNLAAYALAQLLHGPLADRFGRRRLLILGFVGFALASLGCALAQSVGDLLTGRVIQGLCSSVPSVVIVLMIRELYDERRAVRIMGAYGMAIGLAPAIGPLIGGYVYVAAGWRMNFLLLAVIAFAVLIAVLRYLPETGRRDEAALRPGHIVHQYLRLLSLRRYLCYLIPLAAVFGSFFAFVTAGPFLLIDRMGVATQHYGYYYGIIIFAFIAGSFAANRLIGRFDALRLTRMAIVIAFCGGLSLVLPVAWGQENLHALVLSMAVFTFGMGILMASGPICLLDAAGDGPRGPASALAGSLQLGAASLASLSVAVFHDGTALPLAATIAALVCCAALGHLALARPRHRRNETLQKQAGTSGGGGRSSIALGNLFLGRIQLAAPSVLPPVR